MRQKAIQAELKRVEQQTEKLIDQIIEAEHSTIIKAYVTKIKTMEEEKLMLKEKIVSFGSTKIDLGKTVRTALEFLANCYGLWASGRFENKRNVLKLFFPEAFTLCQESWNSIR